jgi:hypothetical protein
VAKSKNDVLKKLNEILAQPQFESLRDAGFEFDLKDILLRHGDPVRQAVPSLGALPGP